MSSMEMLILHTPVVSWEIFQFLGNLKCLETSRHKLCKQTSPLGKVVCFIHSVLEHACALNIMIVDIFLTILAHIIIWFLWWNCPATGYAQFTVNLLYINHTCKITNLMLRHLAKNFLFYWKVGKWNHVFTTTVHCLLFWSLQNNLLKF